MKLINFFVKNYRSIVDSGDIRIEPFQAFVGENNSGKSNLLYSIKIFLTPGLGGVQEADFFDPNNPIILKATFGELTASERKKLRIYLLGDKLILEKHIRLEQDDKSGKIKPISEYHGYIAKPKDWWLSVEGVIEHEGTTRPNWEQIASEHGIIDYVRIDSGNVNKSSYKSGLDKILIEKEDIEFEEPELGQTQALGLQPVLLNLLPNFHLLPAITDYSDEIDKRSSSSTYRRLMGDLADRVLRFDPKYQQIESTLNILRKLLNPPRVDEKREKGQERLEVLSDIEGKLQNLISKLMPSVCGVCVDVEIEETKDLFSRGVSIKINDGKLTEVLMKGHGLQRCVVFGLLQALILNQRGKLVSVPEDQSNEDEQSIILAIEEPELYIHPQMQRIIYGVMKDFASTDQVIFSSHSPMFVEVGKYECIGVVRKESIEAGTSVCQCDSGVLDTDTERKTFQFLSSFGLEQNNMFFANKVILVEGEHDVIAIIATGRELSLFEEFPEELGCTIVATENKDEMPKYMKLLNAFGIPYVILHELDGEPDSEKNENIRSLLNDNKAVTLPNRLEEAVGHSGHFSKTYDAKKFFEDSTNIPEDFKEIVRELFS